MAVRSLSGTELSGSLSQAFPEAVISHDDWAVWISTAQLGSVANHLKEDPSLDFQFLNSISAIDYVEYFDLVYHLTSLQQQHCGIVKTRLYGREGLSAPSVYGVWRGADFQEREIWDLMGIHFNGHPNMKRIMLWEGFEGHPLRKDFL